MKKAFTGFFIITILSGIQFTISGQPVVNFYAPDTVCIGQTVNIKNLTIGGSTYYWSFCTGDANENPYGINIGNPSGLIEVPTYITLIKDGTDCFSFISCQGVASPKIIRYYHGSSF